MAQLFVLEVFNGHVAEGPVRQISREVGEGRRGKAGVAVGQLDLDRSLSHDLVRDM